MSEAQKGGIQILRERRGGVPQELRERLKQQNRIKRALREALKQGPKTVPELASETGIESSVVLWHVMALRKYGEVEDAGTAGDYVRYRLVKGA